MDNALQLAAACATAASDGSLLVPAAFSAFAAPRANSGGARLRASADVCTREGAQSQWSNHALLGSSGVLLARVKGLDGRAMRRGTVPTGEPPMRQRETDVPGRRAIMYRLKSLAAGLARRSLFISSRPCLNCTKVCTRTHSLHQVNLMVCPKHTSVPVHTRHISSTYWSAQRVPISNNINES
jgi:hypothetical protein